MNVELLVADSGHRDDWFLRAEGGANETAATFPLQAVGVLGGGQRFLGAAGIYQDELIIFETTDRCCRFAFDDAHVPRKVTEDRSREDDAVAERSKHTTGPLVNESNEHREIEAEVSVVGDQQRTSLGGDVLDAFDRRLKPLM